MTPIARMATLATGMLLSFLASEALYCKTITLALSSQTWSTICYSAQLPYACILPVCVCITATAFVVRPYPIAYVTIPCFIFAFMPFAPNWLWETSGSQVPQLLLFAALITSVSLTLLMLWASRRLKQCTSCSYINRCAQVVVASYSSSSSLHIATILSQTESGTVSRYQMYPRAFANRRFC